jgi:hypothetical protein
MNPVLVSLIYGLCLVLALALLNFFNAPWYWHVLSLAAAVAVGLIPLPWEAGPQDLAIGSVFLMLVVWGAAFPLFRKHHIPIHRHRHA